MIYLIKSQSIESIVAACALVALAFGWNEPSSIPLIIPKPTALFTSSTAHAAMSDASVNFLSAALASTFFMRQP